MNRGLILASTLTILSLARPAPLAAQRSGRPTAESRIDLKQHWVIQSSAKVPYSGDQISSVGFDVHGWYSASVPTTVFSALVQDGVYPDPYFGMNLRAVPGITGDIGDNFTNMPFPPGSPYAVSWWYRTEFQIRGGTIGKRFRLNFDSINNSANVWLNGVRIAGPDQIRGMYRMYEFDISGAIVSGVNTLAVEVFPPALDDFTITFVDWNPLPPDKDMGLVRDVYILSSGPVAVNNVQVVSQVDSALDRAQLTLYADVSNSSAYPVEGTLRGAISGDALAPIEVTQTVTLAAGETARIAFQSSDFPQLILNDPPLWWPYDLGPQNLETLHLQFETGRAISDERDARFGIRQFTSVIDANQHRLFFINGRPILIRGAGWTHDMMLRVDPEREENEMRYVRGMHLNALRLEGKMLDEHFFDLADTYGILVMPGWCCCSFFEWSDQWAPDDYTVAAESMRSQLRRLRNHASVFVFLYGSDSPVGPAAEANYLNVIRQENWPNPYLAAASDANTPGAGLTGVKMRGPYAYVGPNYWLLDTDRGGAWGFATEISPGHAIPLVDSLRGMFGTDHLWPIDEFWIDHEATPAYPNLDEYTAALEGRYGAASSVTDYAEKSQLMAYESERAMFEAYGRNKYTATGVIRWMGNNAWPSIVWHLYDWYLRPGGGYFGTRKALEPVHVQYSYDDSSIVVVNSLYAALPGYSVTAEVYNLDLTQKFARTASIDIAADSSTRVFIVPQIAGLTTTFFVRLFLRDPTGNLVSSNFYWLSTQPDVYDWQNSNAWETPIIAYADLTALQRLPPAQVTVAWQSETAGADQVEHVTVKNPSSQLAFFVHLTVLKGKGGEDVAPVYWDDNYFELMPGEQRTINAAYPRNLLGGATSYIQVDGWNLSAAN